jgi:hypothetical protein
LLPVMERTIVIRDEEASRDSRSSRRSTEGEQDGKEEICLEDFPKYVDKFLRVRTFASYERTPHTALTNIICRKARTIVEHWMRSARPRISS